MWTCKCGTLWLTRLLMAKNEPSARIPTSTARDRRWAAENSGSINAGGRSDSVSQCCLGIRRQWPGNNRSEEHTSELQSRFDLVCRLLLEKKKINNNISSNTLVD